MGEYKSKLFLTIFIVSAGILAWGVWKNYKPQVVYASCTDIAEKTANMRKKTDFRPVEDGEFDQILTDCLQGAGYYQK
jgi:hypothetical protein